MVTTLKQEGIRTKHPHPKDQSQFRMPHERDESDDSQAADHPREDMKQAYDDIMSGQVDTDFREERGVEEVVDKTPEKYPGGKKPTPRTRP